MDGKPSFLRRLTDGAGIRTKLLLVTLILAAIPLVGFSYVREMERFLRSSQESSVIALARAAATALHDRPRLLDLRANAPIVIPPASSRLGPLPEVTEDAIDRAIANAGGNAGGNAVSNGGGNPSGNADGVSSGTRETAFPDPGRGGRRVTPDATQEINQIIRGLGRADSRIWVIDQQRQLLALTGSLRRDASTIRVPEPETWWEKIEANVLRPIYTKLLSPPSQDFEDATPDAVLASGRDVDSALVGVPESRWRNTSDDRIVVVSAAHPIWSGEEVIGAVIVEETTLPVLTVRHRAFEQLLTMTLAVLVLGAGSLFLFASRLSRRLLQLRNQAEGAIDAQGRVQNHFVASTVRDEIGDLSRSFGTVLERLAQYNTYLERMADRLSHELRTPIAVVGSSLDNLRAEALSPDAQTYIGRAEDGIRRLNRILTQMREATRLEQMLREVDRERFDLARVVGGCVAGYAGAFPNQRFELHLPPVPVWMNGAPDLIAQMLDKVIDNATDFSPPNEPIEVRVSASGTHATLSVANIGPRLPDTMQGHLFDSMITVRGDQSLAQSKAGTPRGPHLGFGLFMVRLIAEFHRATPSARNRDDDRGVVIEVRFPLSA